MSNLVRIYGMDFRGSACDGPGIRGIIFFQGCVRHCHNCQNPETWDINGGEIVSIDELLSNIEAKCPYKRITISGGEPMLQIAALDELVQKLDDRNYEIALYTSFSKEMIPDSILSRLTYIKTGPYIDELRTTTIPYVGSSNQIFEKII